MKLKKRFYKDRQFWFGIILMFIFPNLLELKIYDVHFWLSLLSLILGLYLTVISTIIFKNKRSNDSNRN
ncbi:hypothetical protein GCM10025884_08270 [Leuconostoc gelidum subsp. gelidum]|nr:hypothetical protein GCM10025884_08270 [Leuconostoc gelidum subsp. gelidum]